MVKQFRVLYRGLRAIALKGPPYKSFQSRGPNPDLQQLGQQLNLPEGVSEDHRLRFLAAMRAIQIPARGRPPNGMGCESESQS